MRLAATKMGQRNTQIVKQKLEEAAEQLKHAIVVPAALAEPISEGLIADKEQITAEIFPWRHPFLRQSLSTS